MFLQFFLSLIYDSFRAPLASKFAKSANMKLFATFSTNLKYVFSSMAAKLFKENPSPQRLTST
jgi:hypothetical protein